jgi:hypothetical protein
VGIQYAAFGHSESFFYTFVDMRLRKVLIPFFLTLLIAFPLVERTRHGFTHASKPHCSERGLHICAEEHTCPVCDYVFSSAQPRMDEPHPTPAVVSYVQNRVSFSVHFFSQRLEGGVSQRGPPLV